MSGDSKLDTGALDAIAVHLARAAGVLDEKDSLVEDWFSHPDSYFAQIPSARHQRNAIVDLLTDVWPKERLYRQHPLLDSKGKPEAAMQWLEVPVPKKSDGGEDAGKEAAAGAGGDGEPKEAKEADASDGYPTALYLVSEKGESDVVLGAGLTYRYEPTGPAKQEAGAKGKKTPKASLGQRAKKRASTEAKRWVARQFLVQPFAYFPLLGLGGNAHLALGTPAHRLTLGLDFCVKKDSSLSSKLPFHGLRLETGIAFREGGGAPSFRLFKKNKSDEFELLHAPGVPDLPSLEAFLPLLREFLNVVLSFPQIQEWLEELLSHFPDLDLFAWLRDLDFELPAFHLPELSFPDLDLPIEKWFEEFAAWLSQLIPDLRLPELSLSWVLGLLAKLELPELHLPGLPHIGFDLHKELGFSFAVADKVVYGKKKGSKRKVVLQLGETFGVDGAESWLGEKKPRVKVSLGELVVEGTDTHFRSKPALELASVGLDVRGGGEAPLVDFKGLELAGIGPRVYLAVSEHGVESWGVAARLERIGVPLGAAIQSSGGKNQVAKSLLAGSGGSGAVEKKRDEVNPSFGLSAAYRSWPGSHRLAVQLYDQDDKTTDVVMMPMQRSFGPLHVRKVGVGWDDPERKLSLILDGKVQVKALAVDLEHLSIGFPIEHPTDLSRWELGLDGIGVEYHGGPVEITGAFVERKLPTGESEYAGAVTVKAETFALGALGAYAYMRDPAEPSNGYASMFIFLLVDSTLGGPPVFFVEGLAGGFGYNRRFLPPKAEDVQDFPLVRAMVDPAAIGGPEAGPAEALEKLAPYVPPSHGDYWFAVGVKFTSFELLESSALLVVEFGHDLVITVLGLSVLKLPKEGSPIANVELALEVVLKPSQGTLLAKAVLTDNSWVLDKECKLTGGFAFALWFDTNPDGAPPGDFVLTIGGYHPHFKPPAHYPRVPRLGFNWPVSDCLTIKGSAYFALTPAQVMAGGGLQVLFHKGDLRAWFIAQMDVLIGWDPFHYEALIKISIGASYRLHLLFVTVTVKVEMGADLEIWGPPLGGEAHVHWYIIGFTVGFGADRPSGVPAIPWSQFEKRLLPKPSSPAPVVKIEPKAGVAELVPIEQDGANAGEGSKSKQPPQRWIVRPDDFTFATTSTVPTKKVLIDSQSGTRQLGETGVDFSIRPMLLQNVECEQVVTIVDLEHEDPDGADAKLDLAVDWDCEEQKRSLPQALWGEGPASTKPVGKGEDQLVHGLLVGLGRARPKHPTISGPAEFPIEEALERLPVVRHSELGTLPLEQEPARAATTPARPDDAFTRIRDTILKRASDRTELYQELVLLDVDPGTNEMPRGIAENPAAVFEALPMVAHGTGSEVENEA